MLQNSTLQESYLQKLYGSVSTEFQQVNAVILEQLQSNASLIGDIDEHIFKAGGKRLRPLLVLLSANACGYKGQDHIILAAVIEFLHTATLLHDDVVDASSKRRGRYTANHLWGNASSVLAGDFIYSRAFQMMVKIGNLKVMEVLSLATNLIAEGEVMQLMNTKNAQLSYEEYIDVVYRKTAMLFEASSHAAAVLSGASEEETQALKQYGKHLGLAFQLMDDVLDYSSSLKDMGKNPGDDLAEGKTTLPLIYLMKNGTQAQAALAKRAIEQCDLSLLDEIICALKDSGAIEYTLEQAKAHVSTASKAIQCLPNSPYLENLFTLAHFAIERKH